MIRHGFLRILLATPILLLSAGISVVVDYLVRAADGTLRIANSVAGSPNERDTWWPQKRVR